MFGKWLGSGWEVVGKWLGEYWGVFADCLRVFESVWGVFGDCYDASWTDALRSSRAVLLGVQAGKIANLELHFN